MNRESTLLLSVTMLLGLAVSTATAADLSGTYEGQEKCKVWTGEKMTTKFNDRQLQVTDGGATFVATLSAGALLATYEGNLVDDVENSQKAQGVGLACETAASYAWSSIVIEKSLDKGAQKGSIRARILKNLQGPPATLDSAYEICKFNGKRTSTLDPGVSCP